MKFRDGESPAKRLDWPADTLSRYVDGGGGQETGVCRRHLLDHIVRGQQEAQPALSDCTNSVSRRYPQQADNQSCTNNMLTLTALR